MKQVWKKYVFYFYSIYSIICIWIFCVKCIPSFKFWSLKWMDLVESPAHEYSKYIFIWFMYCICDFCQIHPTTFDMHSKKDAHILFFFHLHLYFFFGAKYIPQTQIYCNIIELKNLIYSIFILSTVLYVFEFSSQMHSWKTIIFRQKYICDFLRHIIYTLWRATF